MSYYYVWREAPMSASLSIGTPQSEVNSWDVIGISKTKKQISLYLRMPKPKGFKYWWWNHKLVRWYWRRHGMNTSWVISRWSDVRLVPCLVSVYEYDMLDAVDIPHADPNDYIEAGPRG